MSGNARWVPRESHLPGRENEPHFECDNCGMAGHVRYAREDHLGRVVHVGHRGCVDDTTLSLGEALREAWPLNAHDANRSWDGVTVDENVPWEQVSTNTD